ncbi:YpmS family protein [Bacillus testis]|uniref:YpmS family protein n=1 Tax=Bacillus testis TaxID=1622072 RepID=UPI00067ED959|nr:YpmS family protein [Bacillus testis]
MRSEKKNNATAWKISFFALAGIIALAFLILFIKIGIPKDQPLPVAESTKTSQEASSINIKADKDTLNKLIANYIRKESDPEAFKYQVILNKTIEFYTEIPVFTKDLQLKMTFKPVPLDNGNLVLKERSMELGNMNLPASYVLNFIDKQKSLPEWLMINPKKEEIYVNLHDIDLFDGAILKVDTFNLKEDDISFKLVVPEL